MFDMDEIKVEHNVAARRFEVKVGRALAHADYRLDGKTMLMTHTEVPVEFEGRGIAAKLVQTAFDYAQAQGLKVRPMCSYVHAWAARHPEVSALLA